LWPQAEVMAISAPKLPIQNRSTISPPSRPGGTKSPIGPSRRERRQARWADYTPTHYTPTQWPEAHSPWPDGYPGAPFSVFLHSPPGPERERPEAQLWPATPTPSGGGAGYGFGVMERADHLSPLPGELSLQPPARVAQMAAAAAHAAAAAAAQAAAGKASSEKVKTPHLHFEEREIRDLRDEKKPQPIGPMTKFKEKRGQRSLERTETVDELPLEDVWKPELEACHTAPAGLPSKGSNAHGSGKCRPCAWYWKPQGCQNDKDCGYCHLCPEGELKNRKKSKVAAMRMGALVPAKPTQKAKYPSARVLKLSPLL